jgi:hypothetical protein
MRLLDLIVLPMVVSAIKMPDMTTRPYTETASSIQSSNPTTLPEWEVSKVVPSIIKDPSTNIFSSAYAASIAVPK